MPISDSSEISLLKELVKILYLFESMTKLVSGSKKPLSVVIPLLMSFHENIKQIEAEEQNRKIINNYLSVLKLLMSDYTSKYFENEIDIMSIAVDPRYKLFLSRSCL